MRQSRLVLFLACLSPFPALCGVIRSPVAVLNTVSDSGSSFSIQNTIDESGLVTPFLSGTDDFTLYDPASKLHSFLATTEWFAPLGVVSATIIYDLGAVYNLPRVAFWNEESAGTQTLTVLTCATSTCASAVTIGTFLPTNNSPNVNSTTIANYTADVFSLGSASGRYVEFLVTGPQAGFTYNSVSIGEVAFDTTTAATPEPSTFVFGLAGLAFLGAKFLSRRRVLPSQAA